MRDILEKKHLVESKHVQLQQMRENEARREAERELDNFYHNVSMKDFQAKVRRLKFVINTPILCVS